MIIRLPEADFSANNVGKITVPRQISEFTISAILAGGRTDLSDTQKSVLDAFFETIGVNEIGNTIASRLSYLFIPMLASDLSKALINYKNNNFVIEGTPNSTYWSVNHKGLVGLTSASAGAITLSLSTPLLANNCCLLFFRGEPMTEEIGNQHYLSIRGKQTTSKWLTMYQYIAAGNANFSTGGLPSQWITGGYTETNKATINGYNLKSTVAKKIIGGVVSNVTAPSVDMSTETSQTIYAFGMSSKNTTPTAFAMLGQGLTESELSSVIASLEQLRNVFIG